VADRYLAPETLHRVIDGMMYSKLNILTLNLMNDYYFRIPSRLSNGKGYKIYSQEQLQQLQIYALIRGVKIVPKVDMVKHFKFLGDDEPMVKMNEVAQKLDGYFINKYINIGGYFPEDNIIADY
jgi:hypothetical protein